MSAQTVAVRTWSEDELRELTPANLFSTIESKNLAVVDAAETLGTGFTVLEDKDKLLGVPFVIIDRHTSTGDNGPFWSLLIVTQNDKLVINDGGAGIGNQLQDLGDDAQIIRVSGGLRKSVFYYNPENIQEKSRDQLPGYKKATTYYLAV